MQFGINDNREQSILECVAAEDIGNFGTNDGANAEVEQSPRGMFCLLYTSDAADD